MIKFVFAIFLIFQLSACGVAQVAEGSNNRSKLMQLNIGDSRETLLKVMGIPELREAYPQGEVWMYYTGHGMGDGVKTPVVIKDGKVVGWGANYYDTVIRKSVEIIKK